MLLWLTAFVYKRVNISQRVYMSFHGSPLSFQTSSLRLSRKWILNKENTELSKTCVRCDICAGKPIKTNLLSQKSSNALNEQCASYPFILGGLELYVVCTYFVSSTKCRSIWKRIFASLPAVARYKSRALNGMNFAVVSSVRPYLNVYLRQDPSVKTKQEPKNKLTDLLFYRTTVFVLYNFLKQAMPSAQQPQKLKYPTALSKALKSALLQTNTMSSLVWQAKRFALVNRL